MPVSIPPITLESLGAALAGVMLMNGIYYPVYFKFGYARAKILSFILFFLFFFGTMILIEAATNNMPDSLLKSIIARLNQCMDLQIFLLIVGAALVFLIISFILSVRIYNSREF